MGLRSDSPVIGVLRWRSAVALAEMRRGRRIRDLLCRDAVPVRRGRTAPRSRPGSRLEARVEEQVAARSPRTAKVFLRATAAFDDEQRRLRAVDRGGVQRHARRWHRLAHLDANLARRVDGDLPLADRACRPRRARCACRDRRSGERRETAAGERLARSPRRAWSPALPGATDVEVALGHVDRHAHRCCDRRPRRWRVPGRTNAPGSMVRVAISPSNGARRTQSFTSSGLRDELRALARRAWPPPTRSRACFISTVVRIDEPAVEQALHARRLVRDARAGARRWRAPRRPRPASGARVAAIERRQDLAALDDRARTHEHRVDVRRDELRPHVAPRSRAAACPRTLRDVAERRVARRRRR